ncbi:MAG: diaminopimelate decarboxylase [Spirochaetales bacterium]|nr:diaminopimelate decarboxylase [Spirochaetales bacterium]
MMYPLTKMDNKVLINGLDLIDITEEFGSPLYIYDLDVIKDKYDSLLNYISYKNLKIYFAMKANWNMDILKTLEKKGSGIDAVSIGDILMAKKAGFSADRIIYTANNITEEEMDMARSQGVLINIGSLSRLKKYALKYPGTSICLRFNPDVMAGENAKVMTGGNLSKFGILLKDAAEAKAIADRAKIKIIGLHEHTGSGIAEAESVYQSMKNLLSIGELFPDLEFVDFGGGFKVPYAPSEKTIDYESFGKRINEIFTDFCESYGRELQLNFEPGKYLSAQCGTLVVQVNTLKNNEGNLFAGVNAGFPQLIRPVFYGAYHHILNLTHPDATEKKYTVVGNICETGDFFAQDRMIPEISEGDLLAIQNAGAYCYSMASVYNLRPLPAEVVVEQGKARLSTAHRSFEDLVELLSGGQA